MSRCGPSLSVAIATYRGEAYLAEQLASIAAQTRLPDEVVLVDDSSGDGTAAVARAWASERSFPVRVEANASNLGVTATFERAVAASTGDVIVLADQDDVWLPHRLEDVAEAFSSQPELGLAFADAVLVDGAGEELGETLWQSLGLDGARRDALARNPFRALVRRNDLTGATMAFSARLRELVLPIPRVWVHDGWIAILAAAVAPIHALRRPAVRYRQHGGNLIGAASTSLGDDVRSARQLDAAAYDHEAARYEAVSARLTARGITGAGDAWSHLLAEKAVHFRRRADVRRGDAPRLATIVEELANRRYMSCSLGWRSAARDLFR